MQYLKKKSIIYDKIKLDIDLTALKLDGLVMFYEKYDSKQFLACVSDMI